MATELENLFFDLNWSIFLDLIEIVAFEELKFHKLFTYAYDLRTHLFNVLKKQNYIEEARLKEHIKFSNKFIDVVINSKFNKSV
jgi:RimJ/RimL family protein N-acetyltransferase